MTVLAVAHRAGNSLAGLHEANALGVDVVECDVHATRSGLEVRHLKTAGPLPFLWDRWELALAGAPRLGLGEVLEAESRGAQFLLDLKGRRSEVGRAVAELLHSRPTAEPVLVCGRSWRSVDHVAQRLPYVRPVLSARTRTELTALHRRLATGGRTTPYGVSLHVSLLDRPGLATLHRQGIRVLTWPINDHAVLERVVSLGVDGVISDEPDVLATVLSWR